MSADAKARFTPGPWVAAYVPDMKAILIGTSDRTTAFARMEQHDGTPSKEELRANADLMAASPSLHDVAAAYEQWEADLILSAEAWEPNGQADTPRIPQVLWDRLIEIQAMRNAALSLARGES